MVNQQASWNNIRCLELIWFTATKLSVAKIWFTATKLSLVANIGIKIVLFINPNCLC